MAKTRESEGGMGGAGGVGMSKIENLGVMTVTMLEDARDAQLGIVERVTARIREDLSAGRVSADIDALEAAVKRLAALDSEIAGRALS